MDPTLLVAPTERNVAVANANAKPKRPLSAFNLFYRYKRQKVLVAISRGNADKDTITRIVGADPGLEDHSPIIKQDATSQDLDDLRRSAIRKDLENNIFPRDTRDRTHRTNHGAMNGAMSFLELGKLMNTSWKKCDSFAKGVFNELSEEGRAHYRKKLKEYNASCEVLPTKKKNTEVKTKAPGSSAKNQDSNKSNKRKAAKKASPKIVDSESDDGGANLKTADARMGHLLHGDNKFTSDNRNHALAPPDLLQLLANGDLSSNAGSANIGRLDSNLETNSLMLRVRELEEQLTANRLRLRVRELESQDTVSRAEESLPKIDRPNNNFETNSLMLRVRELEEQLTANRLRLRVRELESQDCRSRTVESLPKIDRPNNNLETSSLMLRVRELEEQLTANRLRLRVRELESQDSVSLTEESLPNIDRPNNNLKPTSLMLRVRELEEQLTANRLRLRVRELESQDYMSQTVDLPRNIGRPVNNLETNSLMRRVRELETQLTANRLRVRTQELGYLLGRQRTVNEQLRLRVQLEVFSRTRAAPGTAGGVVPNPPQEGLWSLVNASMIHPSIQPLERDSILSKMVAKRQQHASSLLSLAQGVPTQHSPMQKAEHNMNNRNWIEDSANDECSNKKQRMR